MTARRATPPRDITAAEARLLLLDGQALLGDPTKQANSTAVRRLVKRMGFVQVDTINVVGRAHDLTLASRLDGYRPEHLSALIERGDLFEHFTHDASAIDVDWFVPWRLRCRHMADRMRTNAWLTDRLGADGPRSVERVLARIRDEGPLMSKDFQRPKGEGRSAWWGWKPAKAVLEFLWWRGDLSIPRRVNFHKVYDLTERCFPDLYDAEPPTRAEFVSWACAEALDRLTVASARDIRGFHGAVSLPEARAWCATEEAAGRVRPVTVSAHDGSTPKAAVSRPDVRRRIARAEKALAAQPDRMRFLSPFDPVLRDRARALRLFGFDYRFEAFTPAAKRVYGYYVLPVLRDDVLVARADVKTHRKEGVLEIKSLYWEDGRGGTKKESRLFEEACERLAIQVGVDHYAF